MTRKPSHTISERLRYAFDNTMSRGTVSLIIWLGLITIFAVSLVSISVWVLGISTAPNFLEQFWSYMTQTIEADANTGSPWSLRLSALLVTFTSIFVMSTLIGVLTTGLSEKLEQLRKGRSKIIEKNHTIILGWSSKVFSILQELVLANENQRDPCVVILSQEDKVQMEEAIDCMIVDRKNTRIICRHGNPMERGDLEIANPNTSRSIIMIPPENQDPDTSVIKMILAVVNNPKRREKSFTIVTEIRQQKNIEVAQSVGGDEVEVVPMNDLVARMTAQTCRQSGLPTVYTELLSFAGNEIYFCEEPDLEGKTFREIILAYDESTVIGLHPAGGAPQLNPSLDTRFQKGDRIIAISEDDDTVIPSYFEEEELEIEPDLLVKSIEEAAEEPESTLILGWNDRAPILIRELDAYACPESKITLVTNFIENEEELAAHCKDLKNQIPTYLLGDTTDREFLESLALDQYTHVIVLSYADFIKAQEADAHTLITLLHIRALCKDSGAAFSLVSEMLDERNRELISCDHGDDFVISDRLASLILAQISENKFLNTLLNELFSSEASEFYFKPVTDYVHPDKPMTFYNVIESALRRNHLPVGYRCYKHINNPRKAYGVVLNPIKSDWIDFAPNDRILVLAEE